MVGNEAFAVADSAFHCDSELTLSKNELMLSSGLVAKTIFRSQYDIGLVC